MITLSEIFKKHDPRKHTFLIFYRDKMIAINPVYNSLRNEYDWTVYGDPYIAEKIGVKYDFNELIKELIKYLGCNILKKVEVYYGECQFYGSQCDYVATYENIKVK